MKAKKFYQLVTADRSADIYIFGDITSWEWMESDVSSYTLARELQGLDVERINVYINSYGGEVAEATAIYNQLRNHKAVVRTVCDGFACSAASVIFMAGDERAMNKSSLLMIHNALWSASGNAADLRKAADDLETINALSVKAYMDRVNIAEERLKELLDAESWITPEDALAMGFATEIIDDDAGTAASQSAKAAVFQALTGVPSEPPAKPPQPASPPQPEEKNLSTFLSALSRGGKE